MGLERSIGRAAADIAEDVVQNGFATIARRFSGDTRTRVDDFFQKVNDGMDRPEYRAELLRTAESITDDNQRREFLRGVGEAFSEGINEAQRRNANPSSGPTPGSGSASSRNNQNGSQTSESTSNSGGNKNQNSTWEWARGKLSGIFGRKAKGDAKAPDPEKTNTTSEENRPRGHALTATEAGPEPTVRASVTKRPVGTSRGWGWAPGMRFSLEGLVNTSAVKKELGGIGNWNVAMRNVAALPMRVIAPRMNVQSKLLKISYDLTDKTNKVIEPLIQGKNAHFSKLDNILESAENGTDLSAARQQFSALRTGMNTDIKRVDLAIEYFEAQLAMQTKTRLGEAGGPLAFLTRHRTMRLDRGTAFRLDNRQINAIEEYIENLKGIRDDTNALLDKADQALTNGNTQSLGALRTQTEDITGRTNWLFEDNAILRDTSYKKNARHRLPRMFQEGLYIPGYVKPSLAARNVEVETLNVLKDHIRTIYDAETPDMKWADVFRRARKLYQEGYAHEFYAVFRRTMMYDTVYDPKTGKVRDELSARYDGTLLDIAQEEPLYKSDPDFKNFFDRLDYDIKRLAERSGGKTASPQGRRKNADAVNNSDFWFQMREHPGRTRMPFIVERDEIVAPQIYRGWRDRFLDHHLPFREGGRFLPRMPYDVENKKILWGDLLSPSYGSLGFAGLVGWNVAADFLEDGNFDSGDDFFGIDVPGYVPFAYFNPFGPLLTTGEIGLQGLTGVGSTAVNLVGYGSDTVFGTEFIDDGFTSTFEPIGRFAYNTFPYTEDVPILKWDPLGWDTASTVSAALVAQDATLGEEENAEKLEDLTTQIVALGEDDVVLEMVQDEARLGSIITAQRNDGDVTATIRTAVAETASDMSATDVEAGRQAQTDANDDIEAQADDDAEAQADANDDAEAQADPEGDAPAPDAASGGETSDRTWTEWATGDNVTDLEVVPAAERASLFNNAISAARPNIDALWTNGALNISEHISPALSAHPDVIRAYNELKEAQGDQSTLSAQLSAAAADERETLQTQFDEANETATREETELNQAIENAMPDAVKAGKVAALSEELVRINPDLSSERGYAVAIAAQMVADNPDSDLRTLIQDEELVMSLTERLAADARAGRPITSADANALIGLVGETEAMRRLGFDNENNIDDVVRVFAGEDGVIVAEGLGNFAVDTAKDAWQGIRDFDRSLANHSEWQLLKAGGIGLALMSFIFSENKFGMFQGLGKGILKFGTFAAIAAIAYRAFTGGGLENGGSPTAVGSATLARAIELRDSAQEAEASLEASAEETGLRQQFDRPAVERRDAVAAANAEDPSQAAEITGTSRNVPTRLRANNDNIVAANGNDASTAQNAPTAQRVQSSTGVLERDPNAPALEAS